MGTHIELGHALITMVEPHRHSIIAYNRWYEHDHFLSGVLTGPGAFAGRRFAATRDLKQLRFPESSPIAQPVTNGSMIALYWIERDQLGAHCEWGFPEAARLAQLGRMSGDRDHVSTAYYDLVGVSARGARPVPVELALHHPYTALVMIWTEATSPGHEAWAATFRDGLVTGDSPIGQVVTVRPIVLPPPLPMMPGVIIGGDPTRDVLGHCCFVDRDITESWPALHDRINNLAEKPGATLLLVAPFVPTVAGTDTYLDELW
jgi:hypothetical protein